MLNFKLAACKHVHSEKWLGGDNKPILSKGEEHCNCIVIAMLCTCLRSCRLAFSSTVSYGNVYDVMM